MVHELGGRLELKLMKKLRFWKIQIKCWSGNTTGDLCEKKEELEEKTNEFDIKEETRPLFNEEKKEYIKKNLYYKKLILVANEATN